MRKLALLFIFLLTGCLDPEQRQTAPIIEKPSTPDVKVATKDDVTASTNALQTQVQGIGFSMGQLANKMSLIDGDLLKIQNSLEIKASATAVADLKASLQATMDVVANVRNDLKLMAQIDAKLSALTQIDAKLNAFNDLKVKLDAQTQLMTDLEAKVNAQAGLLNKIDELKNDVKSGRDSVVTTIQFTDNVMKTIVYGNLFYACIIVVIITAVCVVVVVLMSNSRKRAEDRYQQERTQRLTLERGGHG